MMRAKLSFLPIFILFAAAAIAVGAPADFAGEWTWDRSQSKDLPPMFDATKAWQLVVAAPDKQFNVDVNIETGRPESPNYRRAFSYPLDGTESKTTSQLIGPKGPQDVPTRLAGKALDDGTLELLLARDVQMKDETRTMKQNEKWELSADKASLTIHMTTDMPTGPVKYDLVFKRK